MTFMRTYIMKASNMSMEQMREKRAKLITGNKWIGRILFLLSAAVIVASLFFLAGGQITAGDMLIVVLLMAGLSAFCCLGVRRTIKEDYSTVTLGEEKIILKDGCENILTEATYRDIRYAQIKMLRGCVEKAAGKAGGKWEVAPFICLHTEYMQIQSEAWESEYWGKYNRVIVFPYVSEAWEILNERIEEGRIAEWDEDGSMARSAIRARLKKSAYYTEHIEAIRELEQNFERQTYDMQSSRRWISAAAGMLMFFACAMVLSGDVIPAAGCFAVGAAVLLSVLLLSWGQRRCRRTDIRRFMGTIELEEEKIILKDGEGMTVRQTDYNAVEYAQVVMMRGNEELNSKYYREKLRPFICLHTQRQEIADGAKKREYEWQYDRVMIFAYDEEAWQTIAEKIPAQRIEEINV